MEGAAVAETLLVYDIEVSPVSHSSILRWYWHLSTE
jgi:hypothetical protein